MSKFILGVLLGVFFTNIWYHYPVVTKERREVLKVEVSPKEEVKVDPRKTFKKGMIYVIVRIDQNPKVAMVKHKMSTHESEVFFSTEEAIFGIQPGLGFYLDHETGKFIVLDPSLI